jgi:hypothetical protein
MALCTDKDITKTAMTIHEMEFACSFFFSPSKIYENFIERSQGHFLLWNRPVRACSKQGATIPLADSEFFFRPIPKNNQFFYKSLIHISSAFIHH